MSERVTFVIPAFNEVGAIATVVEELSDEVVDRLPDAEILIVDDCSTDGTAAVLRRLAERHPRVRVLATARNSGQGPATRLGFENATGDWLCHVDGDGQLDPTDFWRLWEARTEADFVIGVRSERRDPGVRRAVSHSLRGCLTVLTGRQFADAAAPFRLLRAELWQDLRPVVGERAVTFSILVSVAAAARGWRVSEVPISHRARRHGRSTLRGARLVRFAARGALEVIGLRMRLLGRRGGDATALPEPVAPRVS